ncbi:ABC transporter ATP-binding protein [Jatrophihabitans sp. YIM 134969]
MSTDTGTAIGRESDDTDVDHWRGRLPEDAAAAAEAEDALLAPASARLDRDARRLLGDLLRPHKRAVALTFTLVALQTVAFLAAPWLVGIAIDTGLPAARRGDWTPLLTVGIALVVTGTAAGALRWAFIKIGGRVGQAVLYELRRRGFDHAQKLSVSFHERFTSGRVISRLTSDVDTLTELLDTGLDQLLAAFAMMFGIAIVLVVLDWQLALITFAAFVPLYLLFRWFSSRSKTAFRATRETVAVLIVNFVETFNGIRAGQAYRRERRNEKLFGTLNNSYRDANDVTYKLQAVFTPTTTLVGSIALVAILVVGAFRVAGGSLELGVLTAFLLYVRYFFDPLEDLSMFWTSLQSATAALEKISRLLAEEPSVPETREPRPLPDPVEGAVDLDGVDFAYRTGDDAKVVLPHLDLHVPAGQTVALVGATGAGKSTIAKLIARFYDPTSGRVALDGVDLRDLAEADLRRAVVLVTQDNFLFSGSVADNIAFGRPEATREEVEAAARAVGAHEFVAALPEGYDTDVRKRGGRLSAGQRQLVAFARAFLADPAVLVLDEATSSMDVPTERLVQRALRTVLHQRTALIIAHRLSTVEIADRVLVLEDGRVVEDGTPSDLIAAGDGRFASLHGAWKDSLV